jgi:hypothetical protein
MVNKKYRYIQFPACTVQLCQKIGYKSFFQKDIQATLQHSTTEAPDLLQKPVGSNICGGHRHRCELKHCRGSLPFQFSVDLDSLFWPPLRPKEFRRIQKTLSLPRVAASY